MKCTCEKCRHCVDKPQKPGDPKVNFCMAGQGNQVTMAVKNCRLFEMAGKAG